MPTPKILLGISLLAFIGVMLGIKPFAQDPHYHSFANDVNFAGIHNGCNVLSNLGFLISGVLGFILISKYQIKTPIIGVLFGGILLTGFGSAYYHYAPTNESLVWDRLPMVIVFTSFFAQVYAWYFSSKTAFRIWIVSLLIGLFSVWYWQYTESMGRGDLRLYLIVQFLPILLIITTLGLHHQQNTFLWKPLVWTLLWYIGAKFMEHFDHQIFEFTNFVSGHVLKHLAAAGATFYILLMVKRKAVQEHENSLKR